MDVNEPFSIALMWFTGWHLVIMWQHSSPLSLAKPRQYLESYNRKTYVRPPTAWATAKKTGKCWKISATQFCLKMFEDYVSFLSFLFPTMSGWETSEPILWSLLWTDQMRRLLHLPVPETHRADRGVLRSVQNGEIAQKYAIYGNLNRKNDHGHYGIFMMFFRQMGTVFSVTPMTCAVHQVLGVSIIGMGPSLNGWLMENIKI